MRLGSGANEDAWDRVVVGAGAAGLWCAAELGRRARGRARILVLEKTPRTGTKILASGGTHCNLTTSLGAEAAGRLFGARGARFLRHALRILPPAAVRERFAAWGVPTVEAPLEKVFPASGRARDVRDALEREARAAGCVVRLGEAAREIWPERGSWWVELDSGARVETRALVLATGGSSYPKTGTVGDGYRWLRSLDLPLVEPVPALVPLTSPAAWVRDLAGIAVQEVELSLWDEQGRELGRRARPLLFTHRGVSGPGAMDLAEPVARAAAQARQAVSFSLRADLCPTRTREELRRELLEAAAQRGASLVSRALPLELPRRLVQAALSNAGWVGEEARVQALSREQRHRLVEELKGLRIPIDGTLGFDLAEVSAGGLELAAVDPGSMQVRSRAGLYVCGELLDLQGPIGGLNFQAAFATAQVAAHALLGRQS